MKKNKIMSTSSIYSNIPTAKYSFTFNDKTYILSIGNFKAYLNGIEFSSDANNMYSSAGPAKRPFTTYKLFNTNIIDNSKSDEESIGISCKTCEKRIGLPRYDYLGRMIFSDNLTKLGSYCYDCMINYKVSKDFSIFKNPHFITIEKRFAIHLTLVNSAFNYLGKLGSYIKLVDELSGNDYDVLLEPLINLDDLNNFDKIDWSFNRKQLLSNYDSLMDNPDLSYILNKTQIVRFLFRKRTITTIRGNLETISAVLKCLVEPREGFLKDHCISFVKENMIILIDLEKMYILSEIAKSASKPLEDIANLTMDILNVYINGIVLYQEYLETNIIDLLFIQKALDIYCIPIYEYFEAYCLEHLKRDTMYFVRDENLELFDFILDNIDRLPTLKSLFSY
jgi:hypothetical protein